MHGLWKRLFYDLGFYNIDINNLWKGFPIKGSAFFCEKFSHSYISQVFVKSFKELFYDIFSLN